MELTADGKSVRTNAFVQKILKNILWSLVNSLDEIPENPQSVSIVLISESPMKLAVDGQEIRMNPFVQRLSRNIIAGIIHSLDEIPENPENITLSDSRK